MEYLLGLFRIFVVLVICALLWTATLWLFYAAHKQFHKTHYIKVDWSQPVSEEFKADVHQAMHEAYANEDRRKAAFTMSVQKPISNDDRRIN